MDNQNRGHSETNSVGPNGRARSQNPNIPETTYSSDSSIQNPQLDTERDFDRGAQGAPEPDLELSGFLDKRKTNRKGVDYVWTGRIIRLTDDDFNRWSEAYSNIPDLNAELTKADDYYAENPSKDGKWFFPVSRWLEKAHDDHAPKPKDPRTDPEYWREK